LQYQIINIAKCLINSKALMERTVYPCFSIKQQSEEGAVDARVAQVPAVGPVGAGVQAVGAGVPQPVVPTFATVITGNGGSNHSFTAGQNRFFAERKT
jgi:hypothetical protein